jgi:hypothetical protein
MGIKNFYPKKAIVWIRAISLERKRRKNKRKVWGTLNMLGYFLEIMSFLIRY